MSMMISGQSPDSNLYPNISTLQKNDPVATLKASVLAHPLYLTDEIVSLPEILPLVNGQTKYALDRLLEEKLTFSRFGINVEKLTLKEFVYDLHAILLDYRKAIISSPSPSLESIEKKNSIDKSWQRIKSIKIINEGIIYTLGYTFFKEVMSKHGLNHIINDLAFRALPCNKKPLVIEIEIPFNSGKLVAQISELFDCEIETPYSFVIKTNNSQSKECHIRIKEQLPLNHQEIQQQPKTYNLSLEILQLFNLPVSRNQNILFKEQIPYILHNFKQQKTTHSTLIEQVIGSQGVPKSTSKMIKFQIKAVKEYIYLLTERRINERVNERGSQQIDFCSTAKIILKGILNSRITPYRSLNLVATENNALRVYMSLLFQHNLSSDPKLNCNEWWVNLQRLASNEEVELLPIGYIPKHYQNLILDHVKSLVQSQQHEEAFYFAFYASLYLLEYKPKEDINYLWQNLRYELKYSSSDKGIELIEKLSALGNDFNVIATFIFLLNEFDPVFHNINKLDHKHFIWEKELLKIIQEQFSSQGKSLKFKEKHFLTFLSQLSESINPGIITPLDIIPARDQRFSQISGTVNPCLDSKTNYYHRSRIISLSELLNYLFTSDVAALNYWSLLLGVRFIHYWKVDNDALDSLSALTSRFIAHSLPSFNRLLASLHLHANKSEVLSIINLNILREIDEVCTISWNNREYIHQSLVYDKKLEVYRKLIELFLNKDIYGLELVTYVRKCIIFYCRTQNNKIASVILNSFAKRYRNQHQEISQLSLHIIHYCLDTQNYISKQNLHEFISALKWLSVNMKAKWQMELYTQHFQTLVHQDYLEEAVALFSFLAKKSKHFKILKEKCLKIFIQKLSEVQLDDVLSFYFKLCAKQIKNKYASKSIEFLATNIKKHYIEKNSHSKVGIPSIGFFFQPQQNQEQFESDLVEANVEIPFFASNPWSSTDYFTEIAKQNSHAIQTHLDQVYNAFSKTVNSKFAYPIIGQKLPLKHQLELEPFFLGFESLILEHTIDETVSEESFLSFLTQYLDRNCEKYFSDNQDDLVSIFQYLVLLFNSEPRVTNFSLKTYQLFFQFTERYYHLTATLPNIELLQLNRNLLSTLFKAQMLFPVEEQHIGSGWLTKNFDSIFTVLYENDCITLLINLLSHNELAKSVRYTDSHIRVIESIYWEIIDDPEHMPSLFCCMQTLFHNQPTRFLKILINSFNRADQLDPQIVSRLVKGLIGTVKLVISQRLHYAMPDSLVYPFEMILSLGISDELTYEAFLVMFDLIAINATKFEKFHPLILKYIELLVSRMPLQMLEMKYKTLDCKTKKKKEKHTNDYLKIKEINTQLARVLIKNLDCVLDTIEKNQSKTDTDLHLAPLLLLWIKDSQDINNSSFNQVLASKTLKLLLKEPDVYRILLTLLVNNELVGIEIFTSEWIDAFSTILKEIKLDDSLIEALFNINGFWNELIIAFSENVIECNVLIDLLNLGVKRINSRNYGILIKAMNLIPFSNSNILELNEKIICFVNRNILNPGFKINYEAFYVFYTQYMRKKIELADDVQRNEKIEFVFPDKVLKNMSLTSFEKIIIHISSIFNLLRQYDLNNAYLLLEFYLYRKDNFFIQKALSFLNLIAISIPDNQKERTNEFHKKILEYLQKKCDSKVSRTGVRLSEFNHEIAFKLLRLVSAVESDNKNDLELLIVYRIILNIQNVPKSNILDIFKCLKKSISYEYLTDKSEKLIELCIKEYLVFATSPHHYDEYMTYITTFLQNLHLKINDTSVRANKTNKLIGTILLNCTEFLLNCCNRYIADIANNDYQKKFKTSDLYVLIYMGRRGLELLNALVQKGVIHKNSSKIEISKLCSLGIDFLLVLPQVACQYSKKIDYSCYLPFLPNYIELVKNYRLTRKTELNSVICIANLIISCIQRSDCDLAGIPQDYMSDFINKLLQIENEDQHVFAYHLPARVDLLLDFLGTSRIASSTSMTVSLPDHIQTLFIDNCLSMRSLDIFFKKLISTYKHAENISNTVVIFNRLIESTKLICLTIGDPKKHDDLYELLDSIITCCTIILSNQFSLSKSDEDLTLKTLYTIYDILLQVHKKEGFAAKMYIFSEVLSNYEGSSKRIFNCHADLIKKIVLKPTVLT